MANLITKKQSKIIMQDYLIRFSSVSFLIIALLGLFLLAYVIPYYISVSKKDLSVSEQFQSVISAENKENIGESVIRLVSQASDQMKVAELYNKDDVFPSGYFSKIIESKNSNIQINKLFFNIVNKDQKQLLVSGISKNREGLVAFIEDLKYKAGFSSVESPISDFAKDSDISFTLNIKI